MEQIKYKTVLEKIGFQYNGNASFPTMSEIQQILIDMRNVHIYPVFSRYDENNEKLWKYAIVNFNIEKPLEHIYYSIVEFRDYYDAFQNGVNEYYMKYGK